MQLETIGVDTAYVLTGRRETGATTGTQAAYRVTNGAQVASASSPEQFDATDDDYAAVAMYDIEAAAGAGRSFEGEPVQSVLYFERGELSTLGLAPGQVVGIRARGDSMAGTLDDGDWVLVDRSNRDVRQEGVFLLLVSGERRIKRVQRLAGGALYLISDNAHYQPEMIRPEELQDVEILGRCEVRIGRVS